MSRFPLVFTKHSGHLIPLSHLPPCLWEELPLSRHKHQMNDEMMLKAFSTENDATAFINHWQSL